LLVVVNLFILTVDWSKLFLMFKKIVFVCLVFFGGCLASVEDGMVSVEHWNKSQLYEVGVPEMSVVEGEDGEKEEVWEDVSYYFEYPSEASFDGHVMYYEDCAVNFGESFAVDEGGLEIREKKNRGVTYKAGFDENLFVFYAGVVEDSGYAFWVVSEEDVSYCVDLVEKMADSFSNKPVYQSDRFSFRFEIPSDFKMEYLGSGEGILLKKWIESVDPEAMAELPDAVYESGGGYKVEIAILAFENLNNYPDLVSFVGSEYSGYSFEFVDDAVYVDEGAGASALRHYFMMDGDLIYEAYLRVPSFHYGAHKEFFDEFVKTIEIF
jgi:hypothetical protein